MRQNYGAQISSNSKYCLQSFTNTTITFTHHEGVVEGREDVGNAEHLLVTADDRAKLGHFLRLRGLVFLGLQHTVSNTIIQNY